MWPWDNPHKKAKPMAYGHGSPFTPPGQEKHCPNCCVHCQNLGEVNKKLDTILRALLSLIKIIDDDKPKPRAANLRINLGTPVNKGD